MKFILLILIIFVTVSPVEAKELSQKYSRTIILQTDLEEPVANQTIVCYQTPNKLGVNPDEKIKLEITSNELGEAKLEIEDPQNKVFMCKKKEITTPDYCWYFPYSTTSFRIYDDNSKNEPLYIIGQTSPNTCNKKLTEEDLKNGIEPLLPQGTPLPFTNKNVFPPTPTPTVKQQTQTIQEITFWQWILEKIKSIFR